MARAKNNKSHKAKAGGSKTRYGNLHELLILKLQSLYDVEQELTKALPKMAKHASNHDLRAAFDEHLIETKGHVRRLEQALRLLGEQPRKEKASGIRGIAEDGSWVIKNVRDDATRDAALIAAAQYAEHYEMAGYGTAREWANLMGHSEVEDLLQETLSEEEAANEKLMTLAKTINDEANDMEPAEQSFIERLIP